MLLRLLLTAVLAAGLATAQRGGGGGGGGDEGGGRGGSDMGMAAPVRHLTKTEMLMDKLKLNKEQKDAAAQILSAANEKAAPTREQLSKGRIVIANAITGKAGPEDIKKLLEQYTIVSANMSAIEAETFGKLYALLKTNQQAKAPQAFELMSGLFAGAAPGAGRGGEGQGRR